MDVLPGQKKVVVITRWSYEVVVLTRCINEVVVRRGSTVFFCRSRNVIWKCAIKTTILEQGGLKGLPMMLCAEVFWEFIATRELLI